MYINEVNLNLGALTYNNSPNKIIVHHAESSNCTIEDINSWHKARGWSGCGYHYFIRKDGSIYRGRPEDAQGAQCSGQNCESIGICFEGAYMTETMPNIQFNVGLELIADIRNRRGGLPVYGHKELLSTDCPGIKFPLDGFKNGVSQPVSQPQPQVTQVVQSSGDSWIRRLQTECNNQNFSNQIIDGYAGINTLNGCPTLRRGNSGEITRLLQERLNALGYNCGTCDGDFGGLTASALSRYQSDNGLQNDSICGRMSWSKLLGL